MNAIHALSQLSYGPVIDFGRERPDVSACNHRGELGLIQSASDIWYWGITVVVAVGFDAGH
jgi:hypothetical protein